jgi:hypothetical protein
MTNKVYSSMSLARLIAAGSASKPTCLASVNNNLLAIESFISSIF